MTHWNRGPKRVKLMKFLERVAMGFVFGSIEASAKHRCRVAVLQMKLPMVPLTGMKREVRCDTGAVPPL
jgi:hypothetical protein